MKRYILITDPLTTEQEKQLAAAMPMPLMWWHRLPNSWLIVDPAGNYLSIEHLRGIVAGIAPKARMFVTDVPADGSWAMRYELSDPTQPQWLHSYWDFPTE